MLKENSMENVILYVGIGAFALINATCAAISLDQAWQITEKALRRWANR
jgi:hypothetical protein